MVKASPCHNAEAPGLANLMDHAVREIGNAVMRSETCGPARSPAKSSQRDVGSIAGIPAQIGGGGNEPRIRISTFGLHE